MLMGIVFKGKRDRKDRDPTGLEERMQIVERSLYRRRYVFEHIRGDDEVVAAYPPALWLGDVQVRITVEKSVVVFEFRLQP